MITGVICALFWCLGTFFSMIINHEDYDMPELIGIVFTWPIDLINKILGRGVSTLLLLILTIYLVTVVRERDELIEKKQEQVIHK